jgi:hypothetical protein
MRPIILGVCLFAAACSGHEVNSATSPTSAAFAPAQTQAQGGAQLPLNGSFTQKGTGTLNCPPTCPPTTLRINGSETGTATHLGRFSATSEDVVNLATRTNTGVFNFVAANGDELFTRTTGREDEFVPPNISHVTLVATITGGTGRFAAASGTFTIHRIDVIDFATNSGSGTGELSGHINLHN